MNNDFSMVYTIKELAQVLKISNSSAYQLARSENFPKVYVGKRILIPSQELKEWLIQNCNGVKDVS